MPSDKKKQKKSLKQLRTQLEDVSCTNLSRSSLGKCLILRSMITIGILWDAPPQEIFAFSSIHTPPILDSVSKECAWSAGSDNRQAARPDTNSGIWRYEGSYQLSKFRYDNWRIDCNVVSHKTDSHLCNAPFCLRFSA